MFASIFGKTNPATERREFSINGEFYEVCWRRRRNARKLTMRWQKKELQITTPPGVTVKMIEAFIAENRPWIEAEKKKLDKRAQIPSPGKYSAEETKPVIFFRGRPTIVKLEYKPEQHGKSRVVDQGDVITIHLPSRSRLNPARVLENWMKAKARDAIQLELKSVLSELGEDPVTISIRDQRSRWGSCSTTRRMSFNWRLIMTPPLSLRYVVVHEAAHLLHHDHSPRFWQLVETIMPDYQSHQHWLKQNQIALFIDISTRLQTLIAEDRLSP